MRAAKNLKITKSKKSKYEVLTITEIKKQCLLCAEVHPDSNPVCPRAIIIGIKNDETYLEAILTKLGLEQAALHP